MERVERLPSIYRYPVQALALVGMFALTAWLGYGAERTDFAGLIWAFLGLFGLYGVVLHGVHRGWASWGPLVVAGLLLRLLLLLSIPNLSDDVYRFLWDGRLAAQGIHPFALTPAQVMQSGMALKGITSALFTRLNSPDYYTVYPPVCQAMFWAAAKCFPESIEGGIVMLKGCLFAAEGLALWALWRLRADGWAVAAYALHPLVIVEGVGNVHFEVAMLAFLWMGLLLLERRRWMLAALFWALATGVKLLPLLFLPVVWVGLKGRSRWEFAGYFAAFCGLLFLPLWDWAVLQNLLSSLQLYFRQFAFNASIYYALKGLLAALDFKAVLQVRVLGPLLGGLVFIGVWVIAFYRNKTPSARSFTDRMMLAATLYLLLATTVHPWYVLVPFGLSLASERCPSWRYPMVWTAVVTLSYSHYAGGSFQEKYGWITLEYFVVAAAMLWDFTRPLRPEGSN